MSTDIERFLFGGGPSLKFPTKGTEHTVTVAGEPEHTQQTDFDSGEPLFWPDGNPKMQLVIPVVTENTEDDDDDGSRRWFVKGQSKQALTKALRAAKRRNVEEGGLLRIKYAKDGPKEGKRLPPKHYEVTYIPPEADDEHEVAPAVEKAKATAGAGAKKSSISDDEPPF